jgi:hypothetical protein
MRVAASAHYELVVARKRHARQLLEDKRRAFTAQAHVAAPARGGSERRKIKREFRAQRKADIRRDVIAVARSSRVAREARLALTESLAACQMIAHSILRRGLPEALMNRELAAGQCPKIDVASSPRKLRGPNPAGRPRLVVRLRELSL